MSGTFVEGRITGKHQVQWVKKNNLNIPALKHTRQYTLHKRRPMRRNRVKEEKETEAGEEDIKVVVIMIKI